MDRFLHLYATLTSFLATRRDDEEGATAVEYGLIVALIAVFLITALTAMGLSLEGIFEAISAALDGAAAN